MTQEFVRQVLDTENVLYFPFCDWLFPNGLKINNVLFSIPWFGGNAIDVYWYGFLIAFGMLLAVIYASCRTRSFGSTRTGCWTSSSADSSGGYSEQGPITSSSACRGI